MPNTMVRPLSEELQKIAIEELNEDPERVEDDIKHIQEWIKQQPHLNVPTDKQWILMFLRGCKFSLQTTKQKYDAYYTMKNVIPELFKPRNIYSTEIQAFLKAGFILPLPYSKNYVGPRVVLFRYQNFDLNIMNLENMTAFFYMIINILMIEDDNLAVSGVLFWVDLEYFPLSLVFQLTPTFMKTIFGNLEKALPLRIKGCLATRSPAIAQTLFNLSKGYMGPKLRDRVFLYSDEKFEDVFEKIPKDHVPKEYGGENGSVEDIKDYWIKKVESYSTSFAESNQYSVNEAKREGKSAYYDDAVGVDGSFRKLNID